jgi:hypothetical protein
MSNSRISKKDELLKRSRTLVDRGRIGSLSDFQDIPTPLVRKPEEELSEERETPEKVQDVGIKPNSETDLFVRTMSHKDVQIRSRKPQKTARQNFRFTEELALALENCSEDRRLKKNTVVEIALEQYLKNEGYLNT